MKRIGYLGDIHAEDERLEIVLRELSKQNVDTIYAHEQKQQGNRDGYRHGGA